MWRRRWLVCVWGEGRGEALFMLWAIPCHSEGRAGISPVWLHRRVLLPLQRYETVCNVRCAPTSRCLCLALQVGFSYWWRLYIHLDPESCLPCPTRHIFYLGTPRHSKQFWYGCAVSESSKPRVAVCSFFKEPTYMGHQCGVV